MDCFLSCPAEIVFEKHARYNKKKADVTGEKIIRTLIIDDEPLLRQYIRNSIVSCDAEFEITGEAGNGKEACEQICRLHPDVIFIDIRMPLADGLSVLESVSGLDLVPLAVILTGYSDFSYAQKAIKYHAFDYLLKPIKPDQLRDVLERLKAEIQHRQSEVRDQYYMHLFHNHPVSCTAAELSSAFPPGTTYYSLYVCIASYMTNQYSQFSVIGNYWERMQFDDHCRTFVRPSDILFILHENPGNEACITLGVQDDGPDRLHDFADRLYRFLCTDSYPVTILCGPSADEVSALRNHFMDLKNAVQSRLIYAESGIYTSDESEEQLPTAILRAEDRRLLGSLAAEKDFPAFEKLVLQKLSIFEKSRTTQACLLQYLKQICMLLDPDGSGNMTEQAEELVSNTYRYEDLKKGLSDLLRLSFQTDSIAEHSIMASAIRDYIDHHYAEQLSITQLASKYNFSISYISTLFKKTYNISPNEYIIRKRIGCAKDFLANSSTLSIRKVAEMTGYSDPYYFSRIFKMITGQSPSEYRVSRQTPD